MKGLSLSQPFAWSIFDPIADKGVENRSWAPPIADIGTVIAIHAAKSFIENREYACMAEHAHPCPRHELYTPVGYFLHLGITHMPSRKESYTSSAIIGVATIDRVVTEERTLDGLGLASQRRWFFGPFGWVLANRRKLARPIPASGKQGLWRVPEEIEREILIQLGEAN